MRRRITEKQAMLDALRASCGPDGKPNISAVARQFSADRKAVRQLWEARDKLAVLPRPELPAPSSEPKPSPAELSAGAIDMSPADFARWQFTQLIEDVKDARNRGGHGVGKLHELLASTAAVYRAEAALERKRRPDTPEQREARARTLAQRLSPREALVIAEELRKRHLA